MKKRQTKEKAVNRVLPSLTVFSLAVIVISSILYLRSGRPAMQAKKKTVETTKKYASLEGTDHFYWFTQKRTYFSPADTDDKGKEIAATIPKPGEEVKVLDQTKGLTENEAKQTVVAAHSEIQIEKAALGMYDDQPVWKVVGKETSGGSNYYLVGLESGDEVKAIEGI